jgi:hypothetical protein
MVMQGIGFAIQAFVGGFGALDWLLFHGHNTAIILKFIAG